VGTEELLLETLPVQVAGQPDSHLAYTYHQPPAPARGTILYLHGFGSSQGGQKAEHFRRAAVQAGLGFCAFDFQGHGASGGSLRELSITRNLEDIARVHAELTRRGVGPVIVLGSSMGGLAGLWYAALHPTAVRAVLTIAPALDMGRAFAERLGEQTLREWQEIGVLDLQIDGVSRELGWGYVEDLQNHTVIQLGRRLQTPALVLQGRYDTSVHWQGAVDFASTARHDSVELHFFADGDHRLVDRLPGLWALMMEFLDRHGILPRGRRRQK
jgi:pimeloyl-ACP methyl ester carboxylesterase